MMSKIEMTNSIEAINKAKRFFAAGSVFCMFAYVILLGFTAANVVTMRNSAKLVEDAKTELGQIELSYMNTENIIALENENKANFAEPENIAYVSNSNVSSKPVAVLDSKN